EALIEAFAHVGKAYDFEFDFNVTSRIVCTELVYRCYHKKGNIRFPLTKRLGRFTLNGMDIANFVLDAASIDPRLIPFRPVVLILKRDEREAEFLSGDEMLKYLRAIRRGWRPGAKPFGYGRAGDSGSCQENEAVRTKDHAHA